MIKSRFIQDILTLLLDGDEAFLALYVGLPIFSLYFIIFIKELIKLTRNISSNKILQDFTFFEVFINCIRLKDVILFIDKYRELNEICLGVIRKNEVLAKVGS